MCQRILGGEEQGDSFSETSVSALDDTGSLMVALLVFGMGQAPVGYFRVTALKMATTSCHERCLLIAFYLVSDPKQ